METEGASGGASSLLQHLPSRGYFTSSVQTSTPGGLRAYICEHDTSPPEEQFIKTDTTNILIRSLTLKNQSKVKDRAKASSETTKGKRPAEKAPEEKPVTKKTNTGKKESSSKRWTEKELQSLTVERLKTMLKERGLPVRGKKDDLIARLRKS